MTVYLVASEGIRLVAAQTAGPAPVGPWLTFAVIAYLAYRLMKIVLFPNAPCAWCKGSGKKFDGKFWRPCRWCRGAGRKTRFGRKVWNYVTTTREKSE